MPRTKATFYNAEGESLAGLLETPEEPASAYALFAHCFTCSKDITSASRITRALAQQGFAVLRFDFTGLGNSDGDFSNTNFSSNLQDLLCAAEFLEKHYKSPKLLIGHSLGGAAALAVAQHLPSVKAVATIGAPATADHVRHLFAKSHEAIMQNQSARVELNGRQFMIKRQFIDDLEQHNTLDHISALRKALLIFHSPVDETVSINEAARIFTAAKHPKSFVSLDNADHLLSRRQDALYVANVLSAWAARYFDGNPTDDDDKISLVPEVKPESVVVREKNKKFAREIFMENYILTSDEPRTVGGSDLGANPYELLLAALGSCTSMTMRMYANHKKIDLHDIEVELSHSRIHADDCEACEKQAQMIDKISCIITLTGNLDEAQRARLLEIADKCPVHKTLTNQIHIDTKESNPRIVK